MAATPRFCLAVLHLGLVLSCCCFPCLHASPHGGTSPSLAQRRVVTIRGGTSDYPTNEYYPEDHLPDQETVQDRVEAWKRQQQETYKQHPDIGDVRDEIGRVRLLAPVSRVSRAIIFFVLMWRDVHLYEVADQSFKGLKRLLTVIPLVILFIANMAGTIASITSPSHSAKKRLKAILNLDKLVEFCMILYNTFRLTFVPSKYTPREVFIANILHSVLFIVQAQAFTKVSWDEMPGKDLPPPASSTADAPYTSYSYDDSYGGMPAGFAEDNPQQPQQYYGSNAPPARSYDR